MPDEYFFRGTIPQYWRIVYAEYLRLEKLLGREPFEFTEPHPHRQPLAEYVPTKSSVILISFWNIEHTYDITMDAEFSPDREMVQVQVTFQGTFTKEGETALAVWREVKRALAKDGRLIDSTGLVVKSEKPRKRQKNGISCSSLHKMVRKIAYRHAYLNVNKVAPLWSARSKGDLSKDTAHSIDKKLKGAIQRDWYESAVLGEEFVNLLVKKFNRCSGLEKTWAEWKDRKIDDFLL